MHLLPTNLASLVDVADKKDHGGRFTLASVHLRVHGDNTFVAEATDTKVLLRVCGPCVNSCEDYLEHPGMNDAPNGAMEGLIPAAIWAKVFSSAAKSTRKAIQPILKSVAVKLGKEMATFGTTDLDSFPVDQTRLMAGRFPPAADIIDQTRKRATWSVWVDPTHLAKALKAIGSVGCDEDDQAVELMFTDNPAKPFVIEAKRADGIKSTAVVMPLGEKSTIKRKKKNEEQEDEEQSVTDELEQLKAHHEKQVKTLKGDLEVARKQIEEHVEENGRLRQEISDLREALNDRSQRIEPIQESRAGTPVVTLSRGNVCNDCQREPILSINNAGKLSAL